MHAVSSLRSAGGYIFSGWWRCVWGKGDGNGAGAVAAPVVVYGKDPAFVWSVGMCYPTNVADTLNNMRGKRTGRVLTTAIATGGGKAKLAPV